MFFQPRDSLIYMAYARTSCVSLFATPYKARAIHAVPTHGVTMYQLYAARYPKMEKIKKKFKYTRTRKPYLPFFRCRRVDLPRVVVYNFEPWMRGQRRNGNIDAERNFPIVRRGCTLENTRGNYYLR